MSCKVWWLLLAAASDLLAQSPDNLRCEWQTQPIAIQTSTPRFSWIISASSKRQGIRQTGYRVIVSADQKSITRHLGDLWDSGKTNSSATLQITYAGKELASSRHYYWAVETWDETGSSSWSAAASFQTGLLYQKDWTATWIMAVDSPEREPALPMLRRELRLAKPVSRAIVYISGLGQYELHLNGEKLGDSVLAPGWTDYRKTVLYNSFDVTAALHKGDNVFGVMLGNGMYNVPETKGRYTGFKGTFGPPKLLFQAQITFTDGTALRVVSDHTWRTVQGPITFSNTYGGEDYDARLEQPGWDRPGFKEKDWLEAQETEGPGGKLVSQQSPPVQVTQVLKPVEITEPQTGVVVYDLGRNFSGWPEISVSGPRGSSVKLIPGELLDRNGLASQRSSGGSEWYSYTLNGQGIQTWHPRFSYWGFRYVQVERTPDAGVLPEVVSLNGQSIHAAAANTGEFQTSSDLLNSNHNAIDAAMQSNLQSILTDSPSRDKLGWLDQTHLIGSALMYNFDLATFYEKIARDMADAQTSDGLVPNIAPEYVVFEGDLRDSPEWGSAFILDPWLAYQRYGDSQIIADHYDAMKRYAAHLAGKATDGPGDTGLGVTATATHYQDLITLAESAKVLHKPQDEAEFQKQAAAVRNSFNARFYVAETHVYDKGSQTAYAIALAAGLAPDQDRGVIIEKLVADIKTHDNHVTGGDIGSHYVVKALMDNGRPDVLFEMLSHGNGKPLNIEEWFYRGLAGIDFDLSRGDGQQLIIRPSPVGDLTSAAATYNSVLGKITSQWTKSGGVFTLTIDVPPNLSAVVKLPSGVTATVGSGHYVFPSQP